MRLSFVAKALSECLKVRILQHNDIGSKNFSFALSSMNCRP